MVNPESVVDEVNITECEIKILNIIQDEIRRRILTRFAVRVGSIVEPISEQVYEELTDISK